MTAFKDLTGQQFERLTVVSRAESAKDGKARWHCICDCGNKCIVQAGSLKNGHIKSCGCLRKDYCFQDITGQKFDRLTVISRANNSKGGTSRWHCICDCGNKCIVRSDCLRNGNTKSCGCFRIDMLKSAIFQDLTGCKFGRLTVVSRTENLGKQTVWYCICDCGNKCIVQAGSLKNGETRSCGCFHKEVLRKRQTTHGMHNTRTYKIWCSMIQRCTNPNCHSFEGYGGRNITVCDRWMKFDNFYEDMGECPKGLTLERVLNNGNYEPENCIWATREDQGNNRRNNRLVEIDGRTQTIAQWSRELNIGYNKLYCQLTK